MTILEFEGDIIGEASLTMLIKVFLSILTILEELGTALCTLPYIANVVHVNNYECLERKAGVR